MQGILLHLVLGLIVLVLGLGVFTVKIVQRLAERWQPKRQKDEKRILRLPRYAPGWQPDTQLLFTAKPAGTWCTSWSRPCAL